MKRRKPLILFLRVLLAIPVAVAAAVVAVYPILLAYSPLLQVKWFSDSARQFNKRAGSLRSQVRWNPCGHALLQPRRFTPRRAAQWPNPCDAPWNGKQYTLERPEMIPAAEAIKAYPLLVKPFIWGPYTKTFVWLHRADVTESVEEK